MPHLHIDQVAFALPDGEPLLDDVSFHVTAGTTTALIGENGAGKTTLLRIVRGELPALSGVVHRDGALGVMDQLVGVGQPGLTVAGLLGSVAPARIRTVLQQLEQAEDAAIERDDEASHIGYATAIAEYAEAGGYDEEVRFDECTVAALGIPFERARHRSVDSLSGGEQKRLVLEYLLRSEHEVLVLDEPDNYLDVPGKRWLEEQLRDSPKSVLLVSHDLSLIHI